MSALRSAVFARLAGAVRSTAVTDGRTSLDWEELDALLDRAVDVLRGLDTGAAGRVAVMAHNSVETVVAHAAIVLAGLSAVPVSFHLTAGEVRYLLEVSDAAVVLAGPETAQVALQACTTLTRSAHVLAWRTDRVGMTSWEEALANASSEERVADWPPRPPLMFTSGTTGRPKAVEQPPTTFPGGETVAELLQRLQANPLAAFAPHLVVGPMYHTGPLTAVRLLLAGTALVVLPRFEPRAVLEAVQTYGVQGSVMVPTHFSRLLALPDEVRSSYDVSSLRQVVHTGAACPNEVKRRVLEWWGPVLVEAYGGTEVGTTNSIDSAEWLTHPGSVGRCVPPFQVLVLDEDDQELGTGKTGRLCFRDATGRGLVYADSTPAPSSLGPGVFTLGEIGHVDEDGFVYITDRSADLVVSGGVNVYPAEVEQVLMSVRGVVDAAAFGALHPDLGEELRVLVVVDDASLTADELLARCRDQLAGFKCPRRIDVVAELPRTAMGKLDKRVLRQEYGAGVAVSGC